MALPNATMAAPAVPAGTDTNVDDDMPFEVDNAADAAASAPRPAVAVPQPAVAIPQPAVAVPQPAVATPQPTTTVEHAAPATGTAMAQASTGTAVAAPSGAGSAVRAIQDQGFEGTEVGFGSFPQVVLHEGQFKANETELGKSFEAVLYGSRPKYVYKNGAQGKEEEFAFSYDQQFDTAGRPIANILANWRAKGFQPKEPSKYLEVQAMIVSDGPFKDDFVLLSVPPASVNRFSGFLVTQRAKYPGKVLQELRVKVFVGEKVTKAAYPFYPWAFADVPEVNRS